LPYLSPFLSNVSKDMPYSVPAGFFESLNEDILEKIKKYGDRLQKESIGQTSREEIEALSPLLSSLKNKNPYAIPGGYFEGLETKVIRKDSFGEKKESKVISITKRKWYRLAVAAVVIGVIAISGLAIFRSKQVDPNKNPQAWIEKNVDKKVSKDKIDEFVKLAEDESINVSSEKDDVKHAEIKELMKDVPEKEIEAFLNDAVALGSNNDTDGSMNE
jgi:gas vesicle protein